MDVILISTIVGVFALLVGILGTWGLTHRSRTKEQTEKELWGLKKREIQRKQREEIDRLWDILYQLGQITETLNYNTVLDASLDISARALIGSDAASNELVSAVLLFARAGQDSKLHIEASRRLTRADLGQVFPAATGLLRNTIENGEAVHIRNVNRDPELGKMFALHTCTAAYCFPLRSGLDIYGVMLFAHPEPSFFNADRRVILEFICNQANAALQNARLYQDLAQEKERIVEVEGEARKKLARDLHDGPTQSVAAIAMRVNFARRLLEKDPTQAGKELYNVEDLARRTAKEIRNMLFTLRPLVLESKGLVPAIDAMAEKMKETYEQNVLVSIDEGIVALLDKGAQGVVFNIIEEAVNNARKHAKADHIWVRLGPIAQDLAMLEIEDDGVGFDVDAVTSAYEERGSLGMVNLRERAELVNGILHIDSEKGQGTKIQIVIPLSEDALGRLQHR